MSSKVIQPLFHLSPNSIIHLLSPIHNIPRPHLISKEPRKILCPRLELKALLMFPPLVLSVEVTMPVLLLVVVLIFEEGVDHAAVD